MSDHQNDRLSAIGNLPFLLLYLSVYDVSADSTNSIARLLIFTNNDECVSQVCGHDASVFGRYHSRVYTASSLVSMPSMIKTILFGIFSLGDCLIYD